MSRSRQRDLPQPINLKQLSQYVMVSDREGFERLKAIFLEQIPLEIQKIRKAIQAEEANKLESLAHQMKGSCLTMGADRLSGMFRTIEENAALGQFKNARTSLESAVTEFQRVRKFLKNLSVEEMD